MINRAISRRRFLEGTITGGLAVGLESRLRALGAATIESPQSGGLALKIEGDPKGGYSVSLLLNGEPFASNDRSGEFSGCFQNEERSLEDCVNAWRATSWNGNSKHLVLDGECRLRSLNTTVFARVDYEVVTPHVVRKKIRLEQADMFMLFYQVSNRLEPVEKPAKFWSFDQLNWKGGPLHEYFPAAGFRTNRAGHDGSG